MCRSEHGEQLVDERHGLLPAEPPPPLQISIERLAFEHLHDEISAPIRELAHGEDVDDAPVSNVVDGAGLGDQTSALLLVTRVFVPQYLHRDRLADGRLDAGVDGADAPAPDEALDAIGPDHGSDEGIVLAE